MKTKTTLINPQQIFSKGQVAAGLTPPLAAPTHRPPAAHGSAAADQPLPPTHRPEPHPPRWPPAHPPCAPGAGCRAGSGPFRIDHLDAHDAGTLAGRSVAQALVAQPADRRPDQVAGSAAAERAGHPAPATGRTCNQPTLRRSVVQWIDVRNSVPPQLGNGLQLHRR